MFFFSLSVSSPVLRLPVGHLLVDSTGGGPVVLGFDLRRDPFSLPLARTKCVFFFGKDTEIPSNDSILGRSKDIKRLFANMDKIFYNLF